jgi:hypothetical protein
MIAVGDGIPFPGVSPSLSVLTTFTTPLSEPAVAMKQKLLSIWSNEPFRVGYKPKFGWNPRTGQPCMAIKCYALEVYTALSGTLLSTIIKHPS